MNPENLEEGDTIGIDNAQITEELPVEDVTVESIGITKVVCVTLVWHEQPIELVGHTNSDIFELRWDWPTVDIHADEIEKVSEA